MRKKFFSMMLAAVFAILTMIGCGNNEEKTTAASEEAKLKIGWSVYSMEEEYFQRLTHGVEVKCEELGYELFQHDQENDAEKLISGCHELIAQEIDALLVSPCKPEALNEVVDDAHEKGIPVVSYIAPSAWAWHKSRAKNVAKIVDKVASIFPFEYDVYKEAGANVEFVGHPLVDIVKPKMTEAEANTFAGKQDDRKLILIMPGSRLMEIEKMLPTLLEAAKLIKKQLPEVDFVMPRAGSIPLQMLEEKIKASGISVKITEGNNYDLFSVADLALATSGTVTLEAALCGLGSVIVYRTNPLTYFIAKLVVNIPHIGLPNIVAGKSVLPELIQDDFTPEKVAKEAMSLLERERNAKMKEDLAYVKERLGKPGAVGRVAELVLKIAGEKK